MLQRRLLLGGSFAALLPAKRSHADYPNRPIRLMVPFAPGGNGDIMARLAAPILSARLRQAVVVENRGGGGGSIGAEAVVRARPDGYTLLWGANGPLVNSPLMMREPRYDALRDLTPVGLMSLVPMALVVKPSLQVNDLAGLVAYARDRGTAGMTIGTSGVGGAIHIPLEMFKAATGTNLVHVPYRGGGSALPDLLAGTVDGMLTKFSTVLDFHREGRARIVGLAASHRSPLVPEVQTFIEFGLTDFTAATFNGLWAPAGTPDAEIGRLQQALAAVIADTSVVGALTSRGAEPATGVQRSPAGAHDFLAIEIARARQAMVLANIRPE